MKEVMGCFGWVVLAIIVVIGATALEGAIIMWLWNWLAVTMFNAQPITWLMGCGVGVALSVIGGFFKSTVKVERKY